MDFDQLLARFFDTTDLSTLSTDQVAAGIKRLRQQFDDEAEASDRLAIWCLLYMLGAAPEPDEAFEDEADRDAAHEFADAIDEEEDEDE
jgi:hypothetical protein